MMPEERASERQGPSDLVSFESLNVQLFVVGLAGCPHCKQDLGPFLSQTPKNGFVDMMLASTILVVSPGPFGASETSETPMPERPSKWLDTSCPLTNGFPLTTRLSNRTTARQIGKSSS
jgi:hypothetical protein